MWLMMKSKYIFTIIIIILIIGGAVYLDVNMGKQTNKATIGSDNRGYVTKEVYSHPGLSDPKIAIITGMHPREASAKTVVPEVIKNYTLTHDVTIVNYQINVTNDPDDFTIGRHNGECLVVQYVIPDIVKSNYSLVIICHDHEKGYGTDGYYIATSTTDNKSMALGDAVHKLMPDFNYYKRNTAHESETTSINRVNNQISATGTPVFVYEIPEWIGNSDVYTNTNRLFDSVFKVIQ